MKNIWFNKNLKFIFFKISMTCIICLSENVYSQTQNTTNNSKLSESDLALDEFETQIANYFDFLKTDRLISIQQADKDAKPISAINDSLKYNSAISDPYYGYQLFFLVDKTKSKAPSKIRKPGEFAAQTLYIYKRNANNQLDLILTTAVSTGKEITPTTSDTREGYTRIQSAQATYVSRKYGEAMPFSLWFESEYGTAIHQTLQSRCDSLIGARASAGCIRLCPGTAENVFKIATQFPRSSAIVLLDKRNGKPVKYGHNNTTVRINENLVLDAPKVIEGYPVFVRIIDANTDVKKDEIKNLLSNPTDAFKQYFKPVDSEALLPFST